MKSPLASLCAGDRTLAAALSGRSTMVATAPTDCAWVRGPEVVGGHLEQLRRLQRGDESNHPRLVAIEIKTLREIRNLGSDDAPPRLFIKRQQRSESEERPVVAVISIVDTKAAQDLSNPVGLGYRARQSAAWDQGAQSPELGGGCLARHGHMNSWNLFGLLLQDPRDGPVVL